MSTYFPMLFLSMALGCSVNNPANTTGLRYDNTAAHNQSPNGVERSMPFNNGDSKTTRVKNGDSATIDCDDPNGYSLVVVKDPERNSQTSGTVPRVLNIVANGEIRAAIKIPTDSDAMGFSLSSAEKTKEGFQIIIEFGSRYYHRKQFNFICKAGNFYLHKLTVASFDKNDPESMNNWDRREMQIDPDLPLEQFSIFDYLED